MSGVGRRRGLRISLGAPWTERARSGRWPLPGSPEQRDNTNRAGPEVARREGAGVPPLARTFLLPHAPQPVSAGLLMATGRARLGSTGLVRLLRPGASRERGWIRLPAANREAGRGVTGLAASRAAGLAVGSFLGPGPGLALGPRQDAEDGTPEAGGVGSTGDPSDPDSTLRRDGSAAQGRLDSVGFRSWVATGPQGVVDFVVPD